MSCLHSSQLLHNSRAQSRINSLFSLRRRASVRDIPALAVGARAVDEAEPVDEVEDDEEEGEEEEEEDVEAGVGLVLALPPPVEAAQDLLLVRYVSVQHQRALATRSWKY